MGTKISGDLMSVATEITNVVNGVYLHNRVFTKYENTPYKTPLTCSVEYDDSQKLFIINCNVPFPLTEIYVREYSDEHDKMMNFVDSDIVIELCRNEQTVALYNDAFGDVYKNGIETYLKTLIKYYREDDEYSDDNFIVR